MRPSGVVPCRVRLFDFKGKSIAGETFIPWYGDYIRAYGAPPEESVLKRDFFKTVKLVP
tara:strand:+ start:1027 stop:1203 length:177 start_codon:yes stop_codon:yes gene_type:complete